MRKISHSFCQIVDFPKFYKFHSFPRCWSKTYFQKKKKGQKKWNFRKLSKPRAASFWKQKGNRKNDRKKKTEKKKEQTCRTTAAALLIATNLSPPSARRAEARNKHACLVTNTSIIRELDIKEARNPRTILANNWSPHVSAIMSRIASSREYSRHDTQGECYAKRRRQP